MAPAAHAIASVVATRAEDATSSAPVDERALDHAEQEPLLPNTSLHRPSRQRPNAARLTLVSALPVCWLRPPSVSLADIALQLICVTVALALLALIFLISRMLHFSRDAPSTPVYRNGLGQTPVMGWNRCACASLSG